MKKTIFLAAGILLLAAVFMSGCITAPASDDPIVGIWETPYTVTYPDGPSFDSLTFVFNADGTAYSLSNFAGTPVSGKIDFTWTNNGDGKYSVTISDTKETGLPNTSEFVLSGDGLTLAATPEFSLDFTRASPADYAPGLWTGIRGNYKEYDNIQVLVYLDEDGTGNAAIYGPEVLNLEDIFTIEFTWKAEGDKLILTGPQGVSSEFPLVNGELIFSGLYPLHKYTIEDSLYGLWQSDKPHVEDGVSYEIVHFIRFDGTGVEIWTVPGSDKVSFRYPFAWKMIDSVTYEAVYEDGEVWQFKTVDTRLYDGETWYYKVGFDVLEDYAQNKVTA